MATRNSIAVVTVCCWLVAQAAAAQGAPTSAPAPTATEGAAPPAAPTEAAPAETAPAAEPSAEVQARYREVVARAVAEFDAARWAEARALFLNAHELWPSARTYRTLGMTSFELREYARALEELQAALDDPRRPLTPEHRAHVESLIDRTRAFVGRYRVTLSPPDAALLVDGQPRELGEGGTLVLAVGRYDLTARADGHNELRRKLVVQGREDQPLALTLTPVPTTPSPVAAAPEPTPAPPPAPDATSAEVSTDSGGGRLWTWVAAGSAAALGIASAAMWLKSDSDYDDLSAMCIIDGEPRCNEDETDTGSIEELETGHHITLGLSIAAGVAAVVLFFVEGDTEDSAPSVSLGPGGATVGARF